MTDLTTQISEYEARRPLWVELDAAKGEFEFRSWWIAKNALAGELPTALDREQWTAAEARVEAARVALGITTRAVAS